MLKTISIQDWVTLAIGVVGLLTAFIQSRQAKLPVWARDWVKKIDQAEINACITTAGKFAGSTDAEKREMAVTLLQKSVQDSLRLTLPDSIANLLIEWGFSRMKGAK